MVLLVLPVLCLVVVVQLAFMLGWADTWVQHRMQTLAQQGTFEWENEWSGVTVQQYPTDLMTYQQLIWSVKPDILIEAGTFYGGNAFFLASVLENVKSDAKVLTVDIESEVLGENAGRGQLPRQGGACCIASTSSRAAAPTRTWSPSSRSTSAQRPR